MSKREQAYATLDGERAHAQWQPDCRATNAAELLDIHFSFSLNYSERRTGELGPRMIFKMGKFTLEMVQI